MHGGKWRFRPGPGPRRVLVFSWPLATLALGAASGAAQFRPPTVRDLGFMAGCWEGSFQARGGAEGTIEEHYTAPSDDLMLGTTRYLLDGGAVQFELTSIREVDGEVYLRPYPGGVASADGFRLASLEGGVAVFEAPEHDFPKRIIYRRIEDDHLTARTDDGTDDGQAQEWQLRRVACPG